MSEKKFEMFNMGYGNILLKAMENVNDKTHPAFQCFISGDNELEDVVVDGTLDLDKVAKEFIKLWSRKYTLIETTNIASIEREYIIR